MAETDFDEYPRAEITAIKGYAKAQPTLVSNTGQGNDECHRDCQL